MALLDGTDAADAGADGHAHAFRVGLVDLQAGIPDRVDGSGDAVVDEGVHLAGLLPREVVGDLEVPHLTAEAHRERGCVEALDRTDPGTTREHVLPGPFQGVADRGDHPQPGNHYAASAHAPPP